MTTAIVIAALGLQLWAIIQFWPHRQNALAIALAVAASGLAVRGITILSTGNTSTITEETLITVVSAALLFSIFRMPASRSKINDYSITLMDRSPNPILIKEVTGEYLYINKAFEANFEKTSAELADKKSLGTQLESIRLAGRKSELLLLETKKPHRIW